MEQSCVFQPDPWCGAVPLALGAIQQPGPWFCRSGMGRTQPEPYPATTVHPLLTTHCTLPSTLRVLGEPLSTAQLLIAATWIPSPCRPGSYTPASSPRSYGQEVCVSGMALLRFPGCPAAAGRTYRRCSKRRSAAIPPPARAGRRSRRRARAMRRWPAYRQTRRARSSGRSAPPLRNRLRSSRSPTPWKMLAEARLRARAAGAARPGESLTTEAGVPMALAAAGTEQSVSGSGLAARSGPVPSASHGIRRGCPVRKGGRRGKGGPGSRAGSQPRRRGRPGTRETPRLGPGHASPVPPCPGRWPQP